MSDLLLRHSVPLGIYKQRWWWGGAKAPYPCPESLEEGLVLLRTREGAPKAEQGGSTTPGVRRGAAFLIGSQAHILVQEDPKPLKPAWEGLLPARNPSAL